MNRLKGRYISKGHVKCLVFIRCTVTPQRGPAKRRARSRLFGCQTETFSCVSLGVRFLVAKCRHVCREVEEEEEEEEEESPLVASGCRPPVQEEPANV